MAGDTATTHDPAIAKEGDTYYLFFTGGSIHVRSSKDLVHWAVVPDALRQLPDWARRRNPKLVDLWAPDVTWWNGRWHLYYAASEFLTRNSAIGMATSKTLDPQAPGYGWVDQGPVLTSQGTFSDPDLSGWNAIDPNAVLDDQGHPWLVWGSSFDGLFVQRLDRRGRLDRRSAPVNLARRDQFWKVIEAPWIVRNGSWWYLFASYDLCCFGTKSNYNIRVGRSRSLTGPYVDRDGRSLVTGGGSPVVRGYGDLFGPGHQGVLHDGNNWWLYHHFYDGTRNGLSDLSVRPLDWVDGWPVARGWDPSIPTQHPPFD